MSFRTSILVVAVTAALLAAGFVGVVVVGRIAQAVRSTVTSEAARQQFVARWRPPQAVSAELLFPERVSEWSVTNVSTFARIAELDLDRAGVRGTYRATPDLGIEVVACRLEQATEPDDRERAVRALETRGKSGRGTRSFMRINDRCVFSRSPPDERGELWLLPGWLVLFRSDRDIPLPFVRRYLEAISAPLDRIETRDPEIRER